ncbi:MAG: TetR/AcrR family transcriptional regulator [Mycobacteriaceae bacterium]
MSRPKIYDDDLRGRLLFRAAELVSTGGVSALSLRGLAADVGTSTSAVYSLFGNKTGLLRALFVEAFARFGASQSAVPVTADPLVDLEALGTAYRVHALADPHLYGVMFGGALASFEPDTETQLLAASTFEPVLDAATRAARAGLLRTEDAQLVATALWASLHGLVSLELAGFSCSPGEDARTVFVPALQSALRGWLRDAPARA